MPSTQQVIDWLGGVGVSQGRVPSPNIRFDKETKGGFDQLREWAVDELGVGTRSVTADILQMALMAVAQRHPQELLEAIRAEQTRRQQLREQKRN